MAVFFRIKFCEGALRVRIKSLLIRLNFDVKKESDGILIIGKNRKRKLSNSTNNDRELVAPDKVLATFYKEDFYLNLRLGKHLISLNKSDGISKLIILLGLIKNTGVAVFNENSEKTSVFSSPCNFDLDTQFLVKLHLSSIISYLFKILKTSKSKGEKNNGSNL